MTVRHTEIIGVRMAIGHVERTSTVVEVVVVPAAWDNVAQAHMPAQYRTTWSVACPIAPIALEAWADKAWASDVGELLCGVLPYALRAIRPLFGREPEAVVEAALEAVERTQPVKLAAARDQLARDQARKQARAVVRDIAIPYNGLIAAIRAAPGAQTRTTVDRQDTGDGYLAGQWVDHVVLVDTPDTAALVAEIEEMCEKQKEGYECKS